MVVFDREEQLLELTNKPHHFFIARSSFFNKVTAMNVLFFWGGVKHGESSLNFQKVKPKLLESL